MYEDIKKQKNTSLILEVLKENNKIRRGDLYKEVMKKQRKKFGKSSTYQVISRDIDRLKSEKVIRVVSGGQRSQILALN
jgi:CTP synthase (UTP-ammonia lyase)